VVERRRKATGRAKPAGRCGSDRRLGVGYSPEMSALQLRHFSESARATTWRGAWPHTGHPERGLFTLSRMSWTRWHPTINLVAAIYLINNVRSEGAGSGHEIAVVLTVEWLTVERSGESRRPGSPAAHRRRPDVAYSSAGWRCIAVPPLAPIETVTDSPLVRWNSSTSTAVGFVSTSVPSASA